LLVKEREEEEEEGRRKKTACKGRKKKRWDLIFLLFLFSKTVHVSIFVFRN